MTQEKIVQIAIRLRTLDQLFNSFDPSPFHEKDLDEDAEIFIADWAREQAEDAALQIVINLPPDEARRPEATGVGAALSHYFEERARQFERDKRELFRVGRRALLIGIVVLVSCLTASQTLAALIPHATLGRVIEESLIIVGWVANWRPIEIYLYDWWPISRRIRLYRRIAKAPVKLVVADG